MTNQNTRALLDLLATALPRRRSYQLLLAVALVGAGAAITSLSHGVADAGARPLAATASTPASGGVESEIVVLPTVVVRPDPEIPTLATVTVRASDGGASKRPPLRARLLPVHAVTSFASAGSAGSGFGMPYYSFGKPLRRGTEE